MTELRARRPKGTGRVYTRPDSDYYWIHYSFRGQLHREKTHLLIAEKGNERAAEKLLRTRQAEIQLGTFWPSDHRVKVHELYEEVERDYRRSGRKSVDKIEEFWRLHLRPFFRSPQESDTLLEFTGFGLLGRGLVLELE